MLMTPHSHVFLAWQCQATRKIQPVGRLLDLGDGAYEFVYIKAALAAHERGFGPLVAFPDLNAVYTSVGLPPLFSNRVMPRSRPDFPRFVGELGLSESDGPLQIMGISGGRRTTDELEVFAPPVRKASGMADTNILARGIRHVPDAERAIANVQKGEQLLVLKDVQNPHASHALALRTRDPPRLVGYVPDYLARELATVGVDIGTQVKVSVERINPPPAPVHHRLVCRVELPAEPSLFTGDDYQPIPTDATRVEAA